MSEILHNLGARTPIVIDFKIQPPGVHIWLVYVASRFPPGCNVLDTKTRGVEISLDQKKKQKRHVTHGLR